MYIHTLLTYSQQSNQVNSYVFFFLFNTIIRVIYFYTQKSLYKSFR